MWAGQLTPCGCTAPHNSSWIFCLPIRCVTKGTSVVYGCRTAPLDRYKASTSLSNSHTKATRTGTSLPTMPHARWLWSPNFGSPCVAYRSPPQKKHALEPCTSWMCIHKALSTPSTRLRHYGNGILSSNTLPCPWNSGGGGGGGGAMRTNLLVSVLWSTHRASLGNVYGGSHVATMLGSNPAMLHNTIPSVYFFDSAVRTDFFFASTPRIAAGFAVYGATVCLGLRLKSGSRGTKGIASRSYYPYRARICFWFGGQVVPPFSPLGSSPINN